MGLLSRVENVTNLSVNKLAADRSDGDASRQGSGKVIIPKNNLDILKKRISEYQKTYRVFGCILLVNQVHEKGEPDFCEKLTKATGNMGITSPVTNDHALILLPSEMDRELIAHRLLKSLNAEPVLSFRAASPEYVIDRINSMS